MSRSALPTLVIYVGGLGVLVLHMRAENRAEVGGRPDIADAARQMLSGEPGVTVLEPWDDSPDDWAGWDERVWVFHAPIASIGWAFAALLPEREALADVRRRREHDR